MPVVAHEQRLGMLWPCAVTYRIYEAARWGYSCVRNNVRFSFTPSGRPEVDGASIKRAVALCRRQYSLYPTRERGANTNLAEIPLHDHRYT